MNTRKVQHSPSGEGRGVTAGGGGGAMEGAHEAQGTVFDVARIMDICEQSILRMSATLLKNEYMVDGLM